MEAREGISSGVTVIGAEAPSAYHVAPRSEAPNQVHATDAAAAAAATVPTTALVVSPLSVGLDGTAVKKKRGRPRKYGPDGSVNGTALSPMPISSSGDFNAYSGSTNFMTHIITVNAGKDITMEVISFSQRGPRAICILSANGFISNVTLRQPDSSGGTLTYEGRFEILSLSGSFMPTGNQETRSRSGGMSVSLVSPDGRVVGGGVAGLLVAAGPVQVVVGSFLPSNWQDQKPKKSKPDYAPTAVTQAIAVSSAPPPTNAEKEDAMVGHVLQNSGNLNSSLNPPSTFRRENWVNTLAMPDSGKSATDINISLPDS
ncbi:PREDICTED: AT-hook motif nuclear-localized protein 1-like isoform X2 [Lupinus angustifolius]|uniref:AT-hook motif nuclear-localized protein 1-like isoform X2 n=1 Tax=Lupinus angustifolius TaxID=3871 RepID=UPI00092F7949|nr:PREDICTED: AT-hook motif nuclear-localized protein 1-like isoform X2 [Lupinus angustifolius]